MSPARRRRPVRPRTAVDAFVRGVRVRPPEPELEPAADEDPGADGRAPTARTGHPWDLPVVAQLVAEGLDLHPRLTFLVGANGSGKSTLVEAIAVAAGLNPEGGSSSFTHATRASHSALGDALTLVRGSARPRTDFFLRAESLFTAATYLESLPRNPLAAYGGVSLHEQSHGESFLAVATNRLGPEGLYFLDEPEAALSYEGQLALLARMDELVQAGSQWVVATHSPVLVAHPDALILLCDEDGVRPVAYDDVPAVRSLRGFLADPARQVELLLGGG